LLLALAEQRSQRYPQMLEAAREAAALKPGSPAIVFKLVDALLLCGLGAQARQQLQRLEAGAGRDALLWSRIADLYCDAGDHGARLRCAQLAHACAPDGQHLLANLAAAETACGELAQAEAHLDRLIELYPDDAGAQYRRSTLRRQTRERNHVAELRQRLERVAPQAHEVIPLCYALAKELEDLGEFAPSFESLQRGASRRRRGLSYSVADDERVMAGIAQHFDAALFESAGGAQPAIAASPEAPRPPGTAAIFVMGLPRSGTTLVDRILSSHSQVQSLGEIDDFAHAIIRQTQSRSAAAAARPPDRLALIERSARLDFAELGRDYLASVAGRGPTSAMFIDKTPWNFLYLGLIALALPGARIIHVRRHPMDSCFALYKTLFRGGAPYSYDLQDLARYYLAYDRLMQHWRAVLGGRCFELDYEQLVGAQHAMTRQLLEYCGLGFEAQCLDFHENKAPAATASAAQVREPLHARSVQNWKHYRSQLAPLASALRAGGIEV